MSKTVAVLIGHTEQDLGARVLYSDTMERHILMGMRDIIAGWGNPNINLVDVPTATKEKTGILDRIALARQLNPSVAVELHFNSARVGLPNDYALALYRAGAPQAEALANALDASFSPWLRQFGVRRFVADPMPDVRWGRRGAIEDAPYPAVIFEPIFINNTRHVAMLDHLGDYCALLKATLEGYINGI
jgi:N-acetylmuramoyl-L-alanine amidase